MKCSAHAMNLTFTFVQQIYFWLHFIACIVWVTVSSLYVNIQWVFFFIDFVKRFSDIGLKPIILLRGNALSGPYFYLILDSAWF